MSEGMFLMIGMFTIAIGVFGMAIVEWLNNRLAFMSFGNWMRFLFLYFVWGPICGRIWQLTYWIHKRKDEKR